MKKIEPAPAIKTPVAGWELRDIIGQRSQCHASRSQASPEGMMIQVINATVPRIALYSFGILKAPFGSSAAAEFTAAIPSVFGEAETADGFVAHAAAARPDRLMGPVLGLDYGPWGFYTVPRFYRGSMKPGEVAVAATLSLWKDVAAARQYVYSGLHLDALRSGVDWFEKQQCPGYVLWWVPAGAVPTWAEATKKLEALSDDGPQPSAFDFVTHFDPMGRLLGRTKITLAPRKIQASTARSRIFSFPLR